MFKNTSEQWYELRDTFTGANSNGQLWSFGEALERAVRAIHADNRKVMTIALCEGVPAAYSARVVFKVYMDASGAVFIKNV